VYTTKCENKCDATIRLSFSEYEQAMSGGSLACSVCRSSAQIHFSPEGVNFVLRDGPSGGWATKAALENRYRRDRHATMGRRERDHVKPNKLVPNFGGEIAHSWSEAKGAAYQSTYDKVNGEHGARTAAKVAQESARTFDKHIKQEAK
jgi:hypothetical protein